MDELLIGYALNALPPNEHADAKRLLDTDPEAAVRLARLRTFLKTLSADAECKPPTGLAVAAIGNIAAYIVENKIPLPEPECSPSHCCPVVAPDCHDIPADSSFEELPPVSNAPGRRFPIRRWFEVSLMAGIAFLSVGLLVTGVMKIRHTSQVASCKNNMNELFTALSGYADTHHHKFPMVGTPASPNAGSFIHELKVACQLSQNELAVCPAERVDECSLSRVSYAYTLGYKTNGTLHGIRRNVQDVSDAQTPLLADLPAKIVSPVDGPMSPHGKGQNILFADGHVEYSILATVNNDAIYTNQNGLVRAGLHRLDASLGRASDVP